MKRVNKALAILSWCALVAFLFFIQIGLAVAAQDYMLVAPVRYPGGAEISLPALRFGLSGTGPLEALPSIPPNLLYGPHSPAFNRQGELFISNSYGNDPNQGSISRFTFDANWNFIPNGMITGNSLAATGALAFSAGGELFAANQWNGIISRFRFDSTGAAVPNGIITTGDSSQGLAFSSSGELFNANGASNIHRFVFDPSTGSATPNGFIAVPGAGCLHGLAFSARGELFAADGCTNQVFRILFNTGNPTMNGSIPVPGVPLGVAFSGEGELFVSGHGVGGISRFVFDSVGNAVSNGFVSTDRLGEVAVFPLRQPTISVIINIKPGSSQNTINLGSSGVIPVGILSSANFNAPKDVNPDTLTLAGAKVQVAGKSGRFQCNSQDVNGDGLIDLVCHFINELTAQLGDSLAILEGETYSGVSFRGQDSITIVP